jgi:hypothetical protein
MAFSCRAPPVVGSGLPRVATHGSDSGIPTERPFLFPFTDSKAKRRPWRGANRATDGAAVDAAS